MSDQSYFRKQSTLIADQKDIIAAQEEEIAELNDHLKKLSKENEILKRVDSIKGCVLDECVDVNKKLQKKVSIYESYITDIIDALMMLKEDLD